VEPLSCNPQQLVTLLSALDQDVEIVIREKPRSRAGAHQRSGGVICAAVVVGWVERTRNPSPLASGSMPRWVSLRSTHPTRWFYTYTDPT
jgi:hypothetical protein